METYRLIREYIQDKGLKQKKVAELAGMSDVEISEYLRGKKRLTVSAYIRICDALEVPMETFRPKGRSAS